jgi:hypothetical protein
MDVATIILKRVPRRRAVAAAVNAAVTSLSLASQAFTVPRHHTPAYPFSVENDMWSRGFKLKSFVVVRDYIIPLIPASLGPYLCHLLRVAYLDKNLEQRHDETRDVCVRRRAASATPLLCHH